MGEISGGRVEVQAQRRVSCAGDRLFAPTGPPMGEARAVRGSDCPHLGATGRLPTNAVDYRRARSNWTFDLGIVTLDYLPLRQRVQP